MIWKREAGDMRRDGIGCRKVGNMEKELAGRKIGKIRNNVIGNNMIENKY